MTVYYSNPNGTLPLNLGGSQSPILINKATLGVSQYSVQCCCMCSCTARAFDQLQVNAQFEFQENSYFAAKIRGGIAGTITRVVDQPDSGLCKWEGGSGSVEVYRESRGVWETFEDGVGRAELIASINYGQEIGCAYAMFFRVKRRGVNIFEQLPWRAYLFYDGKIGTDPIGAYTTSCNAPFESTYELCSGSCQVS